MTTRVFGFIALGLALMTIALQGCSITAGNIGYKAGYSMAQSHKMSAMIDAMYKNEIPLDADPHLPQQERTLLGLMSPLKISLETFRDSRIGTDGRVPNFREPVDSTVTKAFMNEFERSGHVVILNPAERGSCDFALSGEILEFSSLPFKLVTDEAFKDANKNYNWVTTVVFEIKVEGLNDCSLNETKRCSKVWVSKWTGEKGYDAVPSLEQVGAEMDRVLLMVIKELSNDKDLIRILDCRDDVG